MFSAFNPRITALPLLSSPTLVKTAVLRPKREKAMPVLTAPPPISV